MGENDSMMLDLSKSSVNQLCAFAWLFTAIHVVQSSKWEIGPLHTSAQFILYHDVV